MRIRVIHVPQQSEQRRQSLMRPVIWLYQLNLFPGSAAERLDPLGCANILLGRVRYRKLQDSIIRWRIRSAFMHTDCLDEVVQCAAIDGPVTNLG